MHLPDVFGPENRARCIQRLGRLTGYRILRKPVSISAVLIPLCLVRGVPSILFLQRPMHLRAHPGEIGFPGGKLDQSDRGDTLKTALRETHEEIGLEPDSIDVWCRLSRLDGRSTIYPVLGYCGDLDLPEPPCSVSAEALQSPLVTSIRPNVDEVVSLIVRPIEWLSHPSNLFYTHFRLRPNFFSRSSVEDKLSPNTTRPEPVRYVLPAFGAHAHTQSVGPRIWGLTAIMTYSVLHGLLPNMMSHSAHLQSKLAPLLEVTSERVDCERK